MRDCKVLNLMIQRTIRWKLHAGRVGFNRNSSRPLCTSTEKAYPHTDQVDSALNVKPFSDIPGPKHSIIHPFKYWKDLNMFASQGDKFYEMRFQQYPGMFRENMGTMKAVHIADPEIMTEMFRQEEKYPLRVRVEPIRAFMRESGNIPGLFHLLVHIHLICFRATI